MRIANQLYDKDVAAEDRLRELVDFCETYAVRSQTVQSSVSVEPEDDNVDSDDDDFYATAPLPPRRKPRKRSSSSAKHTDKRKKDMNISDMDTDEEREQLHQDVSEDQSLDKERKEQEEGSETESAAAAAASALFLPERVVGKKTKRWQNYYLVHWHGYTDADNSWEPAEFYEQHWSDLVQAYEASRVPERIVSKRFRLRPKEQTTLEYYEVQWAGQKETTLEPALAVEASSSTFQPLLQAWLLRQQKREEKSKGKRGALGDVKTETAAAAADAGSGGSVDEGSSGKRKRRSPSLPETADTSSGGTDDANQWTRNTRSRQSKSSTTEIVEGDDSGAIHERWCPSRRIHIQHRLARQSEAFALLFLERSGSSDRC